MEHLDDRIWTLLNDDRFIKWVLSPDEETILFWEKWMEAHPDDKAMLLKAREMACDLAYSGKPAGAQDMADAIWVDVQRNTAEITPVIGKRRQLWPWWAAASVLLLLLAGIMLRRHNAEPFVASRPSTPQQQLQKVATVLRKNDLERSNYSAQSQLVYLVDGSKVILQPGASIRHAAFLQNNRREVYMEGNAFFDIAKDAGRPFYVYTRDLVVQVLGTSFKVTHKENGDVTVLVHSGKVAVSKKINPAQQTLILETNHLALYNEQTHDLVRAVGPQMNNEPSTGEIPAAAIASFNFEETPVNQIFTTLTDAYGIPLHYDSNTFSGCRITTSFTDETFEEKLKIICTAIGASYRMSSNGVFLDGKPCK